jgi:hypothetical protein
MKRRTVFILITAFALSAVAFGGTIWVRTVNGAESSLARGDAAGLKWALRLGANPNRKNEKGESLIHQSIAQKRPEMLNLLLDYGGDKDEALTYALETLWMSFEMGPSANNDPAVLIIRRLMGEFRRSKYQPFAAEGTVQVLMEFGGLGSNGFNLIARTGFESGGKMTNLRLASLETEFSGIPMNFSGGRSGGFAVAPGGKCRVTGWITDEGIEATRVESIAGDSGGASIPISGWLPSTSNAFQKRTVLGRALRDLMK